MFLAAALFTGGVGSWFASKNPDGLEWATKKITGKEELKGPETGLHGTLAAVQEKTAFMPDYSFRKPADPKGKSPARLGTTLAGVSGSLLTLFLVFLAGFILKRRSAAAWQTGASKSLN
jgi:cobalt/nickel transport system permease protein